MTDYYYEQTCKQTLDDNDCVGKCDVAELSNPERHSMRSDQRELIVRNIQIRYLKYAQINANKANLQNLFSYIMVCNCLIFIYMDFY